MTVLQTAADNSSTGTIRSASDARGATRDSEAGAVSHRSRRQRLQRAATRNIRRHWLRDIRRILVLVATDLAAIMVLRWALVSLGSEAPGARLITLLPPALFQGWQFPVAVFLSLAITGCYGTGDRRRDLGRLAAGAGLAALLALYSAAWEGPLSVALVEFVGAAVLLALTMSLSRLLVDQLVRRIGPSVPRRRAILVSDGAGDWIDATGLGRLGRGDESEMLILGRAYSNGSTHPSSHSIADLGALIEAQHADTVLVCGPVTDEDFTFVVDTALVSGCALLAASRTTRAAGVVPRTVWINGTALVELTAPSLKGWQMALKRAVDICGSVLGLMLFSPVIATIAVLVRLDSRGPIFFQQVRIGRAGRPFKIVKFRSMVADAERRREELRSASIYGDDRLFKVPNDPRVTRLGAWLRRTSLDELPQLLNVLNGDMSLVGPRPPLPSEVELYEEQHFRRFDMKPGMTGPWQVKGRNRVTDFEEVIRLENEYMRNWSLVTDLQILLRTLPVVLRMDGAH